MTGRPATLLLVLMAPLVPIAAGVMTVFARRDLAGDSWAQGKLVELWIVSAVWVGVCGVAAYTNWRRDRG